MSKNDSRSNQDLTQGNVGAQLTRMTIPGFLGIASMILASMIDAIYIGILGARELAAYSFTFPLVMGLFSLSMGLGSGASSIIARAQGSGDQEKVRRFSTHAFLLTIWMVFCLTLISLKYQSDIFRLMGANSDIHPLIVRYFSLWVLGLILYTLPMITSTILRSVGNARIPGYIMTTTSAFQILLAPIMIFGLLGSPEFGFLGSAWAVIITGAVRCFGMLWVFAVSEKLLLTNIQAIRGIWISTREILYIGFPSMLSSLIGPFSMGVIIWLLAEHGPAVVAGFGITSRIEMLVTMVVMSVASSVGPFVGQNWGARKTDRIFTSLSLAHRFCLLWGLVCFAFLGPFGSSWVSLINDDPTLIESAAWYLWLVPLSYGLLGVGFTSGSVFVALGKPIPGLILTFFRMIVVYIPLAMVFNYLWGYIGIFIATAISNVLLGILSWSWSRYMLRVSIARL